MRCIKDRMIKRDGEQLVWPARHVERVRLTVTIDHVVKITAL